jgi:LPXTG cell wall anchor motif
MHHPRSGDRRHLAAPLVGLFLILGFAFANAGAVFAQSASADAGAGASASTDAGAGASASTDAGAGASASADAGASASTDAGASASADTSLPPTDTAPIAPGTSTGMSLLLVVGALLIGAGSSLALARRRVDR